MSQLGKGSPIRVTVEARAHGWRLDHYLVRLYPNFSRSQFQSSIAAGAVTVNGLPAKSSRRLRVNDVVELSLPEDAAPRVEPEDLPLSVLYEDEHLVAIDKSAGMIVHPGRGQTTGTLVAALQFAEDRVTRKRFANENDIAWHCRTVGFDEGLIIRSTLGRMIMAPALVATHAELDELVEKTRRAVDRTGRELNLL